MLSMPPRSKADGKKNIDKSPGIVARMFDIIAPTYDQLNRIMSLSADVRWRKAALKELDAKGGDLVLDVATGTGDMALAMVHRYGCKAVGMDISRNMMRIAADRWREEGDGDNYSLVQGDALAMPFSDGAFDRATVSFGIRNMPSVDGFLVEARRILKPGGRMVVLELSLPTSPVLRPILLLYLTRMLPIVARTKGGNPKAYRYLTDSIITFPAPEQVEEAMVAQGFEVLTSRPLTFGACHLYVLEKR